MDRKEQAAKLPPQLPANKASVVVSFPDGSRWLLELTPLQAVSAAQIPLLTQVPNPPPEIRTGSDLEPSGASSPLTTTAEISPDQIRSASSEVLGATATEEISIDQIRHAATETAPTSATSSASESEGGAPAKLTSVLRTETQTIDIGAFSTVELYFEDSRGQRLRFSDAVRQRGADAWRIRSYARPCLGFSVGEADGLGGTPGRWRRFCGGKLPVDSGLDPDLGVLFADDQLGAVCIASAALLEGVLGPLWRTQLREFVQRRKSTVR